MPKKYLAAQCKSKKENSRRVLSQQEETTRSLRNRTVVSQNKVTKAKRRQSSSSAINKSIVRSPIITRSRSKSIALQKEQLVTSSMDSDSQTPVEDSLKRKHFTGEEKSLGESSKSDSKEIKPCSKAKKLKKSTMSNNTDTKNELNDPPSINYEANNLRCNSNDAHSNIPSNSAPEKNADSQGSSKNTNISLANKNVNSKSNLSDKSSNNDNKVCNLDDNNDAFFKLAQASFVNSNFPERESSISDLSCFNENNMSVETKMQKFETLYGKTISERKLITKSELQKSLESAMQKTKSCQSNNSIAETSLDCEPSVSGVGDLQQVLKIKVEKDEESGKDHCKLNKSSNSKDSSSDSESLFKSPVLGANESLGSAFHGIAIKQEVEMPGYEEVSNPFRSRRILLHDDLEGEAVAQGANTASNSSSRPLDAADAIDGEIGRLQALMDSRRIPLSLFGALESRMQQLFQKSMGTATSSRAQQLVQELQAADDDEHQLQVLIEISQLLVMGNEDTLIGFPTKQLVPLLINLLLKEYNFELMNQACRALTYLMEALPRSSTTVVEAIPVLLNKIQVIQCIDVAEQALTALKMLSKWHSKPILQAKGVAACLTYLDFFSINAQRTAFAIISNCCQNLVLSEFNLIQESLSTLSEWLTRQDEKSVESICLAFAGLVESFQKDPDSLLQIGSNTLLSNIQQLLVLSPPIISSHTFTSVIHMLAQMCSVCADIVVFLLKNNFSETLKYILIGSSESSKKIELIPRSPQELFELSYLICEMMPCLPQDPIFHVDSLVVEAKKRVSSSSAVLMEWRDEAGIRHFREKQDGDSIDEAQYGKVRLYFPDKASLNVAELNSMEQFDTESSNSTPRQPRWYVRSSEKATPPTRAEFFDDNVELVTSSITVLFPVLYEMYCSSAGSAVKNKCIRALLRMLYFAPPDVLKQVLNYQSIARHVASLLAAQDFRNVISALQIAEILMRKLPTEFRVYFVREGVLHEIRALSKIDVKSWQIETTPDTSMPSTSSHSAVSQALSTEPSDKSANKSESAQSGSSSSSSHPLLNASSPSVAKEDESGSSNVASKIRDVLKKRYMNIKRTFGAVDKESSAMYNSTLTVTTESREKINTWIKEQAQKFDEAYFNVEIINSHPVINVLNKLTESVKAMESMDDCALKALKDIEEIVTNNDLSSFELIHSGLVKKLVSYLSTPQGNDLPFGSQPLEKRLRTFLHVFIGSPRALNEEIVLEKLNNTAFLNLLKKLNACVSHLEQFPVKVFDQSSIGSTGRPGSSIVKFFNMHQLKCLFQRHPSCTNLRQWHSGPVMVDPLASIQNVDRYLVNQGYATLKEDDESESDLSYDDDSSDEDGSLVVADIRMDHGHGTPKLQFLIGKNVLPYNMTLYQAVRQYGNAEAQSSNAQQADGEYPVGYASVWLKTHTLWYRPVPPEEAENPIANEATSSHSNAGKKKGSSRSNHTNKNSSDRSKTSKDKKDSFWESGVVPEVAFPATFNSKLPGLETIKDPSLEVIHLLRVIQGLSYHWGLLYKKNSWSPIIPQTAFINNDLTLKVNRQLQDPLAIMTRNIPSWLSHIAYNFPFLFPFETRHLLFYVTSFDRERALQRLIDTVPELTNSEKMTPRLDKRKRTISRSSILKQAETILQDYGESKTMLEIQYKNEVGTGLGPTLEFYALVSKELQRTDLNMWHVANSIQIKDNEFASNYVHNSVGLFPMPLSRNTRSSSVSKICNKFKLLGKFLAKAIMDSRLVDIPLSLAFYKWMLSQEKYLSMSDLQYVDESLANTIIKLEKLVLEKQRLENDKSLSSSVLKNTLSKITLDGCPVEDLSLDFTLPGYTSIELKKGGKDVVVTIQNLENYLKLLKHWTMNEGVSKQMKAFKEGFDSVFSMSRLQVFYPEELAFIFCGSVYHQWDIQSLNESCRADHGYTLDSQAIKFLFEILSGYNAAQQRQFIQFVTGSPRLPIGGLKSLSPPLTIVKKASDDDSDSNSYLPSVMTCVNYLKLPDYTSMEIMKTKLDTAINEGQLSFHLS